MQERRRQLDDLELLELTSDCWRATLAPASGGNLIGLLHRPSGLEILRPPRNSAELRTNPQCHGTPLLLPPNRIADGCFRFNGRLCRLPVNEPATGSHLHGLMLGRPWRLDAMSGDTVTLACDFTRGEPEFAGWPYEFHLEMRYRLAPETLEHTLTVENRGSGAMPLGVGFHTTFLLPPEESATVQVPHQDSCWEVHPVRRLPTGGRRPWAPDELDLLDGRIPAHSRAIACHFPLGTGHAAVVLRRGWRISYRFDLQYRHLACWNGGGGREFFCIEPMSWMTNAPNLQLPPAVSGFAALNAGESRTFVSAYSVSR